MGWGSPLCQRIITWARKDFIKLLSVFMPPHTYIKLQRIESMRSDGFFMPLTCWSMNTLTACRTACCTLWSVYGAGGDTGQSRMSASDLFSQQLLAVTASCWTQTIFVSECNYHHLVILTMLTASAFTKPLNVNAVLGWRLLQLNSSSCCQS